MKKTVRTLQLTILAWALATGGMAGAQETAAKAPEKTAPAVSDILQVQKKTGIRVVYDINTGAITPGTGIGMGLYYVRGLLESYKKQGVKMKDLDIHVVLHGRAALQALKDDAFSMVAKDPFAVNPNQAIIRELLEHGVHLEVCNVTLKAYGFKPEDVLPGIQVVFDAYTRIIDLQMRGYGYIKFD